MKILPKKENSGSRLLGFSPWILMAACGLLLLLLILFTASNYRREKELINEALVQKSLTLMRFINSSVRESIRMNVMSSIDLIPWQKHVQAAMEQAVEQPGVEFVAILDRNGELVAGAGESLPKSGVDQETKAFINGLKVQHTNNFLSRMVVDSDHTRKFQIAVRYMPPNGPELFPGGPPGEHHFGRGPGPMMMRRFGRDPKVNSIQEETRNLFEKQPVFVLQLDLKQFSSPLRRQGMQIILLAIVTLLVGAGGALSFMTLKGLKGSQLRLGKIRAFTDNLVSSLPMGLIGTDNLGKVQVYNRAAKEIIGILEADVLGKIPQESLPIELGSFFSNGQTSIDADNILHEIILPGKVKSEEQKILQLGLIVVHDQDGKFAGETLLIRDFTEIRRLEKELQRSERLAALGKVAAGVAHELRNPLSSIKGLAVLLRKTFSSGSKDAETADILVREVERLNRSIGELLDYAKPAQLDRRPENIGEILEKTISLVAMDAESYHIRVSREISPVLPVVSIDRDKLKQVFLNLLLNSIQAMPDGGELTVIALQDQDCIKVTVRDSGCGIAPTNLAKVFDPYFTTKSDGTGLGLAMSAKIVEEHGGKIKIYSVVNQFTEVHVFLPIT